MGLSVGAAVGAVLGAAVGLVGRAVGLAEGRDVGLDEGARVGATVGQATFSLKHGGGVQPFDSLSCRLALVLWQVSTLRPQSAWCVSQDAKTR